MQINFDLFNIFQKANQSLQRKTGRPPQKVVRKNSTMGPPPPIVRRNAIYPYIPLNIPLIGPPPPFVRGNAEYPYTPSNNVKKATVQVTMFTKKYAIFMIRQIAN